MSIRGWLKSKSEDLFAKPKPVEDPAEPVHVREGNAQRKIKRAYKRVFRGITGALHGDEILFGPRYRSKQVVRPFAPWVQMNRGKSKPWLAFTNMLQLF